MRVIIILLMILAVLAVYFVFDVERRGVVKGTEAVPLGTDLPRMFFNGLKAFKDSPAVSEKFQFFIDGMKKKTSEIMSSLTEKFMDSIKGSVQEKINQTISPK